MPEVKGFGVAAIRELARQRVSKTSLRAVAEEIGMSFSGLRSFLEGRDPYPHTVKKLTAWYTLARRGKSPKKAAKPVIPRAEVDAAIELLETYMLAGDDERTRDRRVQRVSERLFRRVGRRPSASRQADMEEPLSGDALKDARNAPLDDIATDRRKAHPTDSSVGDERDEPEE